jgi:hypothetical protein
MSATSIEKRIIEHLTYAWNLFCELDDSNMPDENKQSFNHCINEMQRIVGMRILRRDYPETFGIDKSKDIDRAKLFIERLDMLNPNDFCDNPSIKWFIEKLQTFSKKNKYDEYFDKNGKFLFKTKTKSDDMGKTFFYFRYSYEIHTELLEKLKKEEDIYYSIKIFLQMLIGYKLNIIISYKVTPTTDATKANILLKQ